MAEIEVSADPDAMTVQEVLIGYLALAVTGPETSADPVDLIVETVNTWRTLWPTCEAIAARYGVTLTQPVGWATAVRIIGEAGIVVAAERSSQP